MNMYKGLLFLHGHFTRPEDLEETPRAEYDVRTAASGFGKPLGNRAASADWFARIAGRSPQPAQAAAASQFVASKRPARTSRGKAKGILYHLLFLGGRPMHAGHNLDLEEPFEQSASEAGAGGVTTHRRRSERPAAACTLQPQACNG